MRAAGADGLRHVRQADRPAVAFDEFVRHLAPFRIVRQAQLRQDAFKKLLIVALAGTRPDGWMDFGGNPWPTTPEAERIRRDFGISVIDVQDPKLEEGSDDRGPWFAYTVKGTVTSALFGTIECTGHAGSRDLFFSKAGDVFKPASDVDRPSIKQAAYSNMMQNGVTRILGLRGLTWDELAQMSNNRVTKAKGQHVDFKGKRDKEATAPGAPAAQNGVPGYVARLEELLKQLDVPDVRKVIQGLTAFPGKDGKPDFPGFNSIGGIKASKNPEYVAKLAYDKARELVDQGGFKLKQAAAKDEAPAPPAQQPTGAPPAPISPPPPAQVYDNKAEQMALGAEKKPEAPDGN